MKIWKNHIPLPIRNPLIHIGMLYGGTLLFTLVPFYFFRELCGALYLFCAGYYLARSFYSSSRLHALFLAPLAVIVPLISIGTFIYYIYEFNTLVFVILLTIPLCLCLGLRALKKDTQHKKNNNTQLPSRVHLFLTLIFCVLLCAFFFLCIHFQTTTSVLGPWILVRESLLLIYGTLALTLLTLAFKGAPEYLLLPLTSLFYFAAFSITTLLFPLGFGYDPLLHQQTEKHILEFGFIYPKTPYYIGHYILIVFLSKLSSLSVSRIDTFFLPLFASISLPASFSFFFHRVAFKNCALIYVSSISFLLFPFSFLVLTTPWGCASVLTLLFCTLSVVYQNQKSKELCAFLLLLALAIACIHPLAGIPIFGFCILFFFILQPPQFCAKNPLLKKACMVLLFCCLSILALAAFILNTHFSGQLLTLIKKPNFLDVTLFIAPLIPKWISHYHILYDFAYFFKLNGGLLTLCIASLGIYFLMKRDTKMKKLTYLPLIGFFLCISNAFFLALFLHFPSLIWYERMSYITRIFELAPLFLTPFILSALYSLWEKIDKHHLPLFLFASMIFCSSLLVVSLYFSYPHVDPFTNYHGYNLSQTDIKTVHFIHDDMKDNQCLVLANQIVSVTAIREFGFVGYRDFFLEGKKQNLFYYPIPTGSPLYPYFLQMINQPSRETISRVMNTFHVSCVYFVVNQYETRFENIIQQAQSTTGEWLPLDSGINYVFKYR